MPKQNYFYIHELKPVKPAFYYSQFLEQLIYHACEVMGIKISDLHTKSRKEAIRYARWIVWEAAMACEEYTTSKAGKIFGDHDHSTVVHALDTLPNVIDTNSGMKILYESIHAKAGVDQQKINDFHKYRNSKSMYSSPKNLRQKIERYNRAKHAAKAI